MVKCESSLTFTKFNPISCLTRNQNHLEIGLLDIQMSNEMMETKESHKELLVLLILDVPKSQVVQCEVLVNVASSTMIGIQNDVQ